jgi:tetratricopeptide (TPR) repeat protein
MIRALATICLLCLLALAPSAAAADLTPPATEEAPPQSWIGGLRALGFGPLVELYGQRLHHEVLSGKLALVRESVISAAVVALGLGLAFVVVRESRRRVLVVDPFEVSPGLQTQGFSGQVMARRLRDRLAEIRARTAATVGSRNLVQAGMPAEQEVAIPVGHISLGAVFDYLRTLLGNATHVDGEVTGTDETIAVTVRLRGEPAQSFAGKLEDLDALMQRAAEHVLERSQPYMLAVYRRDAGDAEGAIAVLKRTMATRNTSEEAPALNLWGLILRQRGDVAGSIAKFEAAIRAAPKDGWAYENLTEALVGRGDWAEVDRYLNQFVRLRRWRAIGHALLAQPHLHRFDLPAAEKHLARALRRERHSVRALGLMGLVCLLRHDFRSALARGERLARVPQHRLGEAERHSALLSLANGYTGLRDYDSAREYAQRLAEEMPGHWSGWGSLARLAFAERRYADALAHARHALAIRPQIQGLPPTLIASLRLLGRLDEAAAEAHAILARNPRNAPARAALGDILLAQGDVQAAIAEYRRATEDAPSIADGFEGFARALAAQGETDAAIVQFRKAASVAPHWSAPHLGWGDLLLARGDISGAITRYREAIKLDPRWWEAHARLADALTQQGDTATASQHRARAAELEPAAA